MKMLMFKLAWKVKVKKMSNREWGKTYLTIYLLNKEETPKGKVLLSLLNRNASSRMTDEEYAFFRLSYLNNKRLDKSPELNEYNRHLYNSLVNKKII